MFTSSARFAASVKVSHDVAVKCEILDKSGQFVVAHLDVIGGNVSVDASRKTRRQCSLTLQDPTGQLVPDEINDFLQPYSGYHIRLWRGIRWRDGAEELFPLGTFAPYNPKISDTGDSLDIKLDGYDRSKLISRIRWTKPYAIPSGTNTGVAIRRIIDDRMPGMRFNFTPTNATVPATTLGTEADNDPWDDAQKLAASDGMELFFDARDVVTLRPIPDPDVGEIVSLYADDENCTFTSIDRENDASKMYTGVVVYSEGSEVQEPIRVEVWREDTDLKIPYFFPTSLIKTEEQAIETGKALLRRVGRAEFSVSLNTIPDPRREDGDLVRIRRERSKLDDIFVVNAFTIPLDSESEMSVATEKRRTAA